MSVRPHGVSKGGVGAPRPPPHDPPRHASPREPHSDELHRLARVRLVRGITRLASLPVLAHALGCGSGAVDALPATISVGEDAELPRLGWVRALAMRATPSRVDPDAAIAQLANPTPAAPTPVDFRPEPPRSSAEFEALIAAARACDPDDLGIVTRNLAAAGVERWPDVRKHLLAERTASKTEYRRLLELIGGDVPNRYGYFELSWKKSHGYAVKLSEDWFEDLLALAPARVSRAARPVYRDLVITAALLRSAALVASTDAFAAHDVVARLLDTAYVHGGTFRDEVGRALVASGDHAIPALLRESQLSVDGRGNVDDPAVKRSEYARLMLDRMDRLHPQRALDATRDEPALLAAVIAGYGVTRLPEAPPYLVARLDDPIPAVRAAARQSLRAYVEGPGPAIERKELRLVGGGKATGAQLSWRDVAAREIRAELERRDASAAEPPCKLWLKDGTRDAECEQQPLRHFERLVARIDAQSESEEAALIARASMATNLDESVALLDELLATQRGAAHRKTIAGVYVRAAERAADLEQPERVAQLLRKAAMLRDADAPGAAQKMRARALTYEADAPGLDERGRALLLARARAIDPHDARLRQVEETHATRGDRSRRQDWLRLVFAMALAAVGSAAIAIGSRAASRRRAAPS